MGGCTVHTLDVGPDVFSNKEIESQVGLWGCRVCEVWCGCCDLCYYCRNNNASLGCDQVSGNDSFNDDGDRITEWHCCSVCLDDPTVLIQQHGVGLNVHVEASSLTNMLLSGGPSACTYHKALLALTTSIAGLGVGAHEHSWHIRWHGWHPGGARQLAVEQVPGARLKGALCFSGHLQAP